jgi:Ca-activated chloride channel family protein
MNTPRVDFPEPLPRGKSIKLRFASLPNLLWALTAIFLIAGLFNFTKAPRKDQPLVSPPSNEGQAIYLVLDQSGSMEGSKIQSLKQVAKSFIESRPSDLLGVVAFARTANVLAPLTLDHSLVLEELKNLTVVKAPEENGTAIGYAIYKTANLIAATRQFMQGKFKLKGAVIVLVTDGLQDPNALDNDNPLRSQDIPEAAAFAKEQNIHLYIINVEPSMSSDQYEAHRNQMRKATESTGGQFYLAGTSDTLVDVFKAINTLEKTTLPPPPVIPPGESLTPLFITLAVLTMLTAIVLQTTVLRRFPG